MAAEMAMLNVRMEREKRERGNRILAELGYTPSQYVRAVWDRLIDGGLHGAKGQVEAAMTPARTPEQQAESDRKLEALERGDALFLEFAESVGLDPSTHTPLPDSEDELADARYAYLSEKYGW
jgi:RHH-type rel operon transcriptional repressor/antitoxin RelB